MTTAKLVTQFELAADEVQLDSLPPAFRKATLNMALATLACEKVLAAVPQIPKEEFSLVLATHFGEVNATLDFLNGYHETGTPRPILFQNSLHNSTVGFTTIHLGLTGPALTLSSDKETESSAITTMETMLQITPYALVCFVDCLPEALMPHYLEQFPFLKKDLNKARVYLYARSERAATLDVPCSL